MLGEVARVMGVVELFLRVITSPAFRLRIVIPEPPEVPMETLVESTTVPFTASATTAPKPTVEFIV